MSEVVKLEALEILDSRGNPTVEAEVFLADGSSPDASFGAGRCSDV